MLKENMKVELSNQTNYANIYKLVDDNGKTIGTKTVTLAGANCGITFQSWSKYTKREIKKLFKDIA